MRLTKIGHATWLIELAGKRILTDPWMTEPIYTRFTHREPLPMQPEELPPLDLILATHAHEDHLDPATLRRLDRTVPICCPAGEAAEVAASCGFETIHAMEPHDRLTFEELQVTATHARHLVPEIGFVLEGPEGTLFFAGDTQRDERLFRLGERFRIDVAILPIGGSPRPLLIAEEMDASEAAELAACIGAHHVVPSNYDLAQPARFTGDEVLTDREALSRFQEAMRERHPDGRVVVLSAGESWSPDA